VVSLPITGVDPHEPGITITLEVRPFGYNQIALELQASSDGVTLPKKTIHLGFNAARQLAADITAELPSE
jgi:hypothetical protein